MRIGTGDMVAERQFVRAEGSGGTGHARIFPFGIKKKFSSDFACMCILCNFACVT